MNTKKIRFAVIGFGHIGKRHAEMITRHSDAELIAVADTNNQLKETAEKDFNSKFFNSIEELLNANLEIDVVNICTPNGLHASQSLLALEKKCRITTARSIVIGSPIAVEY